MESTSASFPEASSRLAARLGSALSIAVAVIGFARLILAAGADLEPVAQIFDGPDDAYYYFQIAWNLSRGLGSTFDGLHPTSGYQPLWCALLTVLARLSHSRTELLHAAAWAAATLHAGAGIVLARAMRRLVARPLPALFLVLWLWHPGIQHFVVLEAPLNTFLLACFVVTSHAALLRGRAGAQPAAWWKPGLVLAALAMARLDNVALAPAFGLLPLLERRDSFAMRARNLLALAAPVLVALVVYGALNQAYIGAPLPVSGTIKARWQANAFRMAAQEMWEGSLIHMPLSRKTVSGVAKLFVDMTRLSFVRGVAVLGGAWLPHATEPAGAKEMLVTGVLVAWALLVAIRPRLTAEDEPAGRVLRAWIGGTALHFAGMVYMVGTFPRTWHWVVEAVLLLWLTPAAIAGLGAALGSRAGARGARGGASVAALVAAAALSVTALPEFRATAARFVHGHDVLHPEIDAARWWRGVLPDGTRIGSWNAGHLGYFTDYQIVNLDGLVNTPDYQARIDRDGYLAYFAAERIPYLLESMDDVNFRQLLGHGRVIAEHAEKNGTRLLLLELEPYVAPAR